MSLYLPVQTNGSSVAIAICYRCQRKVYHDDLMQDPNNKQYYCKDCIDIFDPWRLPARQTEDIKIAHPRPDTELS